MDTDRVSSLSSVEPRFHALRKRLDEMGYLATLGIESFPLVERLFNDISVANERTKQLQNASSQSQKQLSILSKSVDPYKKENSRLLSENNKLRHQLLTAKEKADTVARENLLVQRKGEQQTADLQFLVAQYAKKVHRLENESSDKSKKILELQEKNLQAVILTPGGKKQSIPFRRQRLEIEQAPASLASPATLPHVVTQVKDVYVADMVKMADSSLAAERNRCNELQNKLEKSFAEKNAIQKQVEVRDLEVQRLSKLLESGQSPESIVYHQQMNEQAQKIEKLKLQVEALQNQNEELRVMRPDKEPPMSRRLPKPTSTDKLTDKKYIGREKRIEEELWDQLKDLKRKFSTLQLEHENCQKKIQDLRSKLASKDEQQAKLEVLIQQINKEKEELGARVRNLMANERSLLEELGRFTSTQAKVIGDDGVSVQQDQLEAQLESLTEYVHQLESQRDQYREEIRGLLRLMPQTHAGRDHGSNGSTSIDPVELEAKLKMIEEERNFFRRNYQDLLAENLTKSERRRAPSGCVTTTDKGTSAVDEEVEELRKQKQEAERIVELLQQRLDQAQDSIMNLLKDKEALMSQVSARQSQQLEEEEVQQGSSSTSRSSPTLPSEADGPPSFHGSGNQSHANGQHEMDGRRVSGSDLGSSQTQIIQLNYDIKQAQEETQRVREELEKAEQEVQRLEEVTKQMQAQISSSGQEIKDKEQLIASLQVSAENQEMELASLRNLLETVQTERDAALTASARAQQAEHLQEQQRQESLGIQASLSHVDNRVLELQLEVRRREADLSSVREQLRIQKEKSDQLEEDKENIRKENRRAMEDLLAMTSQFESLGQNLEKVQQTKDSLERQIQEYVTEVTRVQELLAFKERERLELLEQYAHLSSEHIELERQHSTLESHSDSVVGLLNNKDLELQASQDTIASLENEIEQHLLSQEAMNSQMNQLNGSVMELGSELEQVTSEASKLKTELESTIMRCTQLEIANSQLQRQVSVSQNDKDQLTNRQEELQQEMSELREQLIVLRGHIAQLENLLMSCRDSEYRHQTSSQMATTQAEALDRELLETKGALDAQRRSATDLKSKLSDLEFQLDRMKRDLTNEKFEKERAHQELRRYRQQHSCYVERHGSTPALISSEETPVSTGTQSVPGNGRGRLAATFRGPDTGTRPKKIAFSTTEKS